MQDDNRAVREDERDQSEVLAFLGTNACYGIDAPLERIDTHISAIFLIGDKAYKLKKAVAFPYLDFTGLEQRRRACEAEVAINRRTAPGIYLGVVPIVRQASGKLSLGGAGEVRDWLVVMRRFARELTLDRLAEGGRLTPEIMGRLIDGLAEFYERAARCDHSGGAAGIERVILGNRASFARLPNGLLGQDAVLRLDEISRAKLARLAPLLDRRRAEGFVRRCHGDLHLRNIVMIDDVPTLFDAIEFNPDFAEIDVLYDFAFLIMDLFERDLAQLCSLALNRFLDLGGDYEGLKAWPLFLSARAAIRAHVVAAASQTRYDPESALTDLSEARRYLDLALAFLAPAPKKLIAIGGLSGSGKTALARALAPHVGPAPLVIVLRSDVLRKQLHQVPLEKPLPPSAYGAETTNKVYRRLDSLAASLLGEGFSVIVDAVFADAREREAVRQAAGESAFAGLWLEAGPETMAKRLSRRQKDASDADPAVLLRQLGYDLGAIDWTAIDAGGSKQATLGNALVALAQRFPGLSLKPDAHGVP
jgi:aminoglycoside phosphotransferase family enzyme/predicted kinase